MTASTCLFRVKVFETINLISIALKIKPLVKLILHSQSADKLTGKHLYCFQRPRSIRGYRTKCHPKSSKGRSCYNCNPVNRQKCTGGPAKPRIRHPREVVSQDQITPAAQGPSLYFIVTGELLGHLNVNAAGWTPLTFGVNSSAVGNDCVNRLDSGSSVRSHCIGGFLIGEQVRFCRPAAKSSICDPIGSHVPLIWTGGLQRQCIVSKTGTWPADWPSCYRWAGNYKRPKNNT